MFYFRERSLYPFCRHMMADSLRLHQPRPTVRQHPFRSDDCIHISAAGLTYCALATFALIATSAPAQNIQSYRDNTYGSRNLLRWLLYRQTTVFEEDEEQSSDDGDSEADKLTPSSQEDLAHKNKDEINSGPMDPWPGATETEPLVVGFNGRSNKIADTCYSFWVVASLDVSPTQSTVKAP